eukprot:7381600-Prymnesium_polylepis.2
MSRSSRASRATPWTGEQVGRVDEPRGAQTGRHTIGSLIGVSSAAVRTPRVWNPNLSFAFFILGSFGSVLDAGGREAIFGIQNDFVLF